MGPVEKGIEFVTPQSCEGVDGYMRVWNVLCKLPNNPVQGALLDMIIGTKDSAVPVMKVGILLVEDM